MEYVGGGGGGDRVGDDLAVLLAHVQCACKRIAALVASPFNAELGRGAMASAAASAAAARDDPKPLDVVSVISIWLT